MNVCRAFSALTIKDFDDEQRIITGTASTPQVDRVGDIVESTGLRFNNPVSLLLYHDKTKPVGQVWFEKPTKDGIRFRAHLPKVLEAGIVRERVEEAWHSLKYKLLGWTSIGFSPDEDAIESIKTGWRFVKSELLELSLVTVPANQSASIDSIKAFCKSLDLAASGHPPAGVPASRTAISARKDSRSAVSKPITEQIRDFEATRETKQARMTEIMTASADSGETLDEPQAEEYDRLEDEIKSINAHLTRLARLEEANRAKAVPVVGTTSHEGTVSRAPVISVNAPKLPPGIGFARFVMCQINSRFSGIPAYELAKTVYPDYHELHQFMIKAAVPGGTTTQAVWASPLVDQTTLASEFIEYLRPMTVIGRLPALRRVPFNVRIPRQTGGGTGYWVGEGAPKPLTSFAFDAVTLSYTKVAAIAVITQELARFSNPAAESLVRDALRDALVERLDRDFIDPAEAGTANVQPASITNGLTALTSAGTSADNARTDLANLLNSFVTANVNPTSLALIMPNSLALALSVLVNSLGQPEFPGINMSGGTLNGIPVVASQYAANASGSGNMVIAVNQSDIFLADDGAVTIDASREASLQMLDNPTNNAASGNPTTMVSMFQTNSIALRAEREINWTKRRTSAVVYMDDVNWGSIGSP